MTAQTARTTHRTTTAHDDDTTAAGRRRRRALVLATAPLTGLATWAVVDLALGVDLVAREGATGTRTIGPDDVVVAALVVAAAGWGLLALLERWRGHGRWWAPVAWTVLALSLLGTLAGIGLPAVAGLMALHVTVGLAVILTLRRGRPAPLG